MPSDYQKWQKHKDDHDLNLVNTVSLQKFWKVFNSKRIIHAVTRIRTWVFSATTRGTNHYTITAIRPLLYTSAYFFIHIDTNRMSFSRPFLASVLFLKRNIYDYASRNLFISSFSKFKHVGIRGHSTTTLVHPGGQNCVKMVSQLEEAILYKVCDSNNCCLLLG